MTVYQYKGFYVSVRHYSTEELVKIDEDLPDTGSSQEAGFYWDEYDEMEDEANGAPCGPYSSEEAAKRAWVKTINRL